MQKKAPPMPKVVNRGYSQAGASYTKRSLKGFLADSGHPAEDINENLYTLRQRSRILYMSAPIATAALKRQRTNIVGNGLKLKSTINREVLGLSPEEAEAWQKQVEAEFALWAENKNACDATGVNDFYGMQQLVMLAWPMSGDVFALVKRYNPTPLMPYSLRLHIIEADRVRTPTNKGSIYPLGTTGKADNGNTIFDGVEVDASGRIVAYYIANTYLYQSTVTPTEFERVEAYGRQTGLPNILQVMDSERPDQYRGVPYLSQIIEPVLQLRRYTEAEIVAAIVQAYQTAFITTEGDPSEIPVGEVIPDGEQEVSSDPSEYEMGPGVINVLKPGEGVTFNNPTHPNTGFDVFVRSIYEQIGAALEVPADLLIMSFNSSYSASRAALLEAWKAFRMRREWLTRDFCKPVYELWLTEAVARGRISAPGFLTDPLIRQAYLQSEWIGPSQGQLDPTKEVEAAVTAIENGLSNREAEAIKLNGSEYRANVEKLAWENERLREANGGTATAAQPEQQPEGPPAEEEPEGGDEQNEQSESPESL